MSTDPQSKSEKHTLEDRDSPKGKPDLATEFKLTKAGIWDVYEQIPHNGFSINIPWLPGAVRNLEIIEDLPFVWRLVKDMGKIESCWYYLFLFISTKVLVALQPAVALWYEVLRILCIWTSLTLIPQVHQSLPHRCSYLFFEIPSSPLTKISGQNSDERTAS